MEITKGGPKKIENNSFGIFSIRVHNNFRKPCDMWSIMQYKFCTSVLRQFLSGAKPKYRIVSVFERGHSIQAIEYAIIKTVTRPNLKASTDLGTFKKSHWVLTESLKEKSNLITLNHSHKHHGLSNPFSRHPCLSKAFAGSSVMVFYYHTAKLLKLPTIDISALFSRSSWEVPNQLSGTHHTSLSSQRRNDQ